MEEYLPSCYPTVCRGLSIMERRRTGRSSSCLGIILRVVALCTFSFLVRCCCDLNSPRMLLSWSPFAYSNIEGFAQQMRGSLYCLIPTSYNTYTYPREISISPPLRRNRLAYETITTPSSATVKKP